MQRSAVPASLKFLVGLRRLLNCHIPGHCRNRVQLRPDRLESVDKKLSHFDAREVTRAKMLPDFADGSKDDCLRKTRHGYNLLTDGNCVGGLERT